MSGWNYEKSTDNVYKKYLINILIFIFIQITVFCTYSIAMIYYGPFTAIRDMIVTTAMTTMNHQYIATWFLSQDEINQIMSEDKINYEDKKSDVAAISVAEYMNNQNEHKEAVQLINISTNKIKGYVMLIRDPSKVFLATADKIGVEGSPLLDIIKNNNAVGGINAGGFEDDNGHGNGGTPIGLLIKNGTVIEGNDGKEYPIIGFNTNNIMMLGKYSAQEALAKGIKDAVTFGPYLVVDGKSLISEDSTGGWGLAPRTAIGQKKDGTVIMLVIDGRQINSIGATLKEVQDIMLEFGAYNAANLDGGSSSILVCNNKIINSPCSKAGSRYLPSAFVFKE